MNRLRKEIRETNPFTIDSKKKNKPHLGLNLTKEGKNLYYEIYKTLKKEI
jgi:hypothetical protein